MNTQIFNRAYNIPIGFEHERFFVVGPALGIHSMQGGKLVAVNHYPAFTSDLFSCMHNDIARCFAISTDTSGKFSFIGGTPDQFGDSYNMPYAVYDMTSMEFVGFYRLDAGGAIMHIAGIDNLKTKKKYVARVLSDTPIAFANPAVKAQAALAATATKGLQNILSVNETADTTNSVHEINIKVHDNHFNAELTRIKVTTLEGKHLKRLWFPFHSAFEGTWYPIGAPVQIRFPLDTNIRYVLIFFEDTYGTISFPLVYIVNP